MIKNKIIIENWFILVGLGIGLMISDAINIIRLAFYLNLDLANGDTEQMAIQMFHYINTGTDPVAIFMSLSRLANDIGFILLLLGVAFCLVNREMQRDKCIGRINPNPLAHFEPKLK